MTDRLGRIAHIIPARLVLSLVSENGVLRELRTYEAVSHQ